MNIFHLASPSTRSRSRIDSEQQRGGSVASLRGSLDSEACSIKEHAAAGPDRPRAKVFTACRVGGG